MDVRKDSLPKRLSMTRNRSTPSLSLQASRGSSAATASRPPLFVHEDSDTEDDPSTIHTADLPAPTVKPLQVQRKPHPLQEASPNRSPRKSSQQSVDGKNKAVSSDTPARPSSRTLSPAKPAAPDLENIDDAALIPDAEPVERTPAHRHDDQLKADLVDLLQRQTASRPGSAAGISCPHRRKTRPLGRAVSGVSNHSLSASAQSGDHDDAVDGFSRVVSEPAPPSTQLGYETADAEAHRLQMSKKLGLKGGDQGGGLTRVASVGIAKDSCDVGPGGRSRGRRGVR